MLTTHQLQVERRERDIGQSSVCAHHKPATGGEERESHRAIRSGALTTHQLQVERRERHRANQVLLLTTQQLQVERRERHRANQVYVLNHTAANRWEERERDIEPIKCMRSPHTSYRWRGESHSANQVYALTTTPATGGEERET